MLEKKGNQQIFTEPRNTTQNDKMLLSTYYSLAPGVKALKSSSLGEDDGIFWIK